MSQNTSMDVLYAFHLVILVGGGMAFFSLKRIRIKKWRNWRKKKKKLLSPNSHGVNQISLEIVSKIRQQFFALSGSVDLFPQSSVIDRNEDHGAVILNSKWATVNFDSIVWNCAVVIHPQSAVDFLPQNNVLHTNQAQDGVLKNLETSVGDSTVEKYLLLCIGSLQCAEKEIHHKLVYTVVNYFSSDINNSLKNVIDLILCIFSYSEMLLEKVISQILGNETIGDVVSIFCTYHICGCRSNSESDDLRGAGKSIKGLLSAHNVVRLEDKVALSLKGVISATRLRMKDIQRKRQKVVQSVSNGCVIHHERVAVIGAGSWKLTTQDKHNRFQAAVFGLIHFGKYKEMDEALHGNYNKGTLQGNFASFKRQGVCVPAKVSPFIIHRIIVIYKHYTIGRIFSSKGEKPWHLSFLKENSQIWSACRPWRLFSLGKGYFLIFLSFADDNFLVSGEEVFDINSEKLTHLCKDGITIGHSKTECLFLKSKKEQHKEAPIYQQMETVTNSQVEGLDNDKFAVDFESIATNGLHGTGVLEDFTLVKCVKGSDDIMNNKIKAILVNHGIGTVLVPYWISEVERTSEQDNHEDWGVYVDDDEDDSLAVYIAVEMESLKIVFPVNSGFAHGRNGKESKKILGEYSGLVYGRNQSPN